MTVIVANDTPDAIRGMLKRWFVEPRPNVFVGTINRRTREKTLDYIKRNAEGLGMLIISSDNNSKCSPHPRGDGPFAGLNPFLQLLLPVRCPSPHSRGARENAISGVRDSH